MPKSKLLGEMWKECCVCGITYPESQLMENSKGELKCKYCWDENEEEQDENT